MPNLPTTRQSQPNEVFASTVPTARRLAKNRAADRRSLEHAFLTFTEAAGSLEKSYGLLQAEVGRLRADLEYANTELSRSLEETSRVRAFLFRILEGLPCGVLVTDSLRQPRMLNPEARRLLNIDPEWGFKDGICPPGVSNLLAEVGLENLNGEQEWTSNDLPDSRILGVSAGTAADSPNADAETIWILRDISDQKRLASEREATRRAHALAEIATVLAHEIRNPLGSMELFAGLLASATAQMPEARDWVTHLQAGLRSLSATVNNVLQFHSEPCAEMIPVRIDRLVRETADFLRPLARQRGLQIVVENAIGAVTVAGDAQRLQQVLFNLSLNAFHAMSRGQALTIAFNCEMNRVCGRVQMDFHDQGCGISPASVEKIFDPGFTTKAGSPGLGLSVCRKVIEQHGGEIRVQSMEHSGSTFSILLPILGENH
jgi:signal transduction histidine kinase